MSIEIPDRECTCPMRSLGTCVPVHEHHRYGCRPHDHVALPDHHHFWSNDDGRGYRECAFCYATMPSRRLSVDVDDGWDPTSTRSPQ